MLANTIAKIVKTIQFMETSVVESGKFGGKRI